MLLNGPASPLLATTVTPAATAAWSARDTGSSWVFGTGFPPMDSLSTFTWSCITAHSIAWMICELKNPALRPGHVQHRQAGAGRDALDLDVAPRWQRVRRVDEAGQVVGLVALRGDRARVQERLAAIGRRAGTETAEVLVVEDDVLAAGPDQIGVVRVDAVGDDADLDPGPVHDLFRGVHVHHFARLGLGQRLGRVARADLLRCIGLHTMVLRPGRERRARPAAQRGEVPQRVGDDGLDRGVGLQPADLGRGDGRGDRVDDVVAAHVRRVDLAQFGQHARLGRVGGLDPRVVAVAPLAGSPVSWFLKMMIDRCVAPAASRSTCAAVSTDLVPLNTRPGEWAATAAPLAASGSSAAVPRTAARRRPERKRMMLSVPSRNWQR